VHEKAEVAILKYQLHPRRNVRDNKKRRNLITINWEDIPEKRREVILGQQRALMAVSSSDTASVASSLIGTTKQLA
jgi:hypothetical protein